MRHGVDPQTGNWLTGWEHCLACLNHLFTTRIGTVPWRRLYGAAIKSLQDRNATSNTIIDFYSAIADAVDKHEPGFRLRTIELVKGGRDGQFQFLVTGIFYPRGHLGDYSIEEDRSNEFIIAPLTPGRLELV